MTEYIVCISLVVPCLLCRCIFRNPSTTQTVAAHGVRQYYATLMGGLRTCSLPLTIFVPLARWLISLGSQRFSELSGEYYTRIVRNDSAFIGESDEP
jgi:hypothetical protein